MSTLSNHKRSVMTLYSDEGLESHAVRIVLAEKGVAYDVVNVSEDMPEDLLDLNPYGSVPTLVDRDLVLYQRNIIMEYLDERFPHPPLLPIYPIVRAKSRLLISRIDEEWFSLAKKILSEETLASDKETAREELKNSLLSVAPIFSEMPFFLNEDFTLVDCCMGPLLWRLPAMGVEITGRGAKSLLAYAERLFSRNSFKVSLTEVESDIRETEDIW